MSSLVCDLIKCRQAKSFLSSSSLLRLTSRFVAEFKLEDIVYLFQCLIGSTFARLIQVIRQVEACRTLEKPSVCPDAVYQLMRGCWRRQPADRLSIKVLRARLDQLHRDEKKLRQQQQRQPVPIVAVVDVDDEAAKSSDGDGGSAVVSSNVARTMPTGTQYLQLLPGSTTSSLMDWFATSDGWSTSASPSHPIMLSAIHAWRQLILFASTLSRLTVWRNTCNTYHWNEIFGFGSWCI